MGKHGKYRPLVKFATIAALCLIAAPAQACRLALVLALDVSSSVDASEDALQRGGLANALIAPEVQDAFFASPDPVAVQVFEWSGRGHQTDLVGWALVETPRDLFNIAARLNNSQRAASGLPTALGYALGHAALQLQQAPDCLFQTIDIAGDGINNAGFGPASVYATFPFEGVTVNGLVVATASDTESYYRREVIRGPFAFVEVARDFDDFEDAMRRKLVRELSAQIIGQMGDAEGTKG